MRKIILFCVTLMLFACNKSNIDLILEDIRFETRSEEIQTVENLSALQNELDTSKRLIISYVFKKGNVKALKSGILQIDKKACFSLFLNDTLVLQKTEDSFFQDTLLSVKKDTFIYADSLASNYFIPSSVLQKAIVSGKNTLLLHFHNPKHYKLNHKKTKLFLSKNNKNYPQNIALKRISPSSLPFLIIHTKTGIKNDPKQIAKLTVNAANSVVKEEQHGLHQKQDYQLEKSH